MKDPQALLKLEALRATSSFDSIGVFDSGVGGLSILRALHQRLPGASMIYLGDVAHAPYGDRTASAVVERSMQMVDTLVAMGATMIVVACNTATVLAIEALRARWPAVAFVGVEPGVKPAAVRSRTRRIAVMATVATARSARLAHLIARYAEDVHVHLQPCPGLADLIERGVLEGADLMAVLAPYCDAIRAAEVDTVVLGCTHYPFVEPSIRELLGDDITVIDTASAIAERSASLWEQRAPAFDASPTLRVISTGERRTMQLLLARCDGQLGDITAEVLTIIPSNLPG
jgi:glutamate racemase